ncbi:MAG: UDP-3-O-(3-hydroxymyristoyl) glucosamine N-acyltransferase [Flavobacteriales bacterium BRH_c54]|nr:MAG: UDP-3-O-(3-hydroxymyristoyl) glucosamine N-acyltransferase [Flavobacteriales bacterium BRH_c54]
MEFSAEQIAGILNGEVIGNSQVKVNKLSKIEEGEPQSISFLANMAYEHYLYTTDASIVIINRDLKLQKSVKDTCTLIKVDNAYECFAKLLETYQQMKGSKTGIEQPSFISESAKLGENCYVGAFAYIGENVTIGNNVKIYPNTYVGDNTTIGDNTILFSGVKLMDETVVGKNCIFHAGVVIGSDGFGFTPDESNVYSKVPQIGNVVVEDDVEIGGNTVIDRATMGSTVIKKGVKLDNLVHIAHNVVIGENSAIAGQVGIAGSAKIGKNCMMGGQVGVAGHLTVADGTKIAAQSGIGANIKVEGTVVQGSPAFYIGDYKRAYVGFKKLPEILDRLDKLEKNNQ